MMCFICGKPIAPETAKTSEYGRALHKECYVLRTKLKQATTPMRKFTDATASTKRPVDSQTAPLARKRLVN
jgi:hypothetical protein